MAARTSRKFVDTKTVTIKDVPGEYAEIFNQLLKWRSLKEEKTKAEVFSEIVCICGEEYFGSESVEDSLKYYKHMRNRLQDDYADGTEPPLS